MKNFIKESLRNLLESGGFRIVPQDYSKEFNQTGSGKSISGVSNKLIISDEKLTKVMAELALAKEISLKYKRAWDRGEQGLFVTWQGRKMLMRIPKELRTATDPNGKPVDYSNYFNIPTVGDGGFQFKLFRNGSLVGANVKSKVDIETDPDLTSATDAGYNKEYDDRLKYFFVKAGIMGKYQEEAGRFASILDTPAIDASIKVRVIFHDEILDFLTKDKRSRMIADPKAKDISNKMEFSKKIEKIRKDAESVIGKPISSNKTWLEWRDQLRINYDTPEKQEAMDIDSMTKDFVELYRNQNTVLYKGKQQITMAPDEEAEWEKQQKEKLARIAAAKARMKK